MTYLMTTKEVAVLLRTAPATIRVLARNGTLQAVKVGVQWRFPSVAILRHLHSISVLPKPNPGRQP